MFKKLSKENLRILIIGLVLIIFLFAVLIHSIHNRDITNELQIERHMLVSEHTLVLDEVKELKKRILLLEKELGIIYPRDISLPLPYVKNHSNQSYGSR